MESAVYEILRRAISDPTYRELLLSAPQEALANYELTAEERQAITSMDFDTSRKFFEKAGEDQIFQFRCGCGCRRCGGGCGGCGCGGCGGGCGC